MMEAYPYHILERFGKRKFIAMENCLFKGNRVFILQESKLEK
jgi:hypothetical protein